MTRINLVHPKTLTDQHLMAEYRELPMVPGSLRRSLNSKQGNFYKKVFTNRGNPYTLNGGHVKFFYDKKLFLQERYALLVEELRLRGFDLDPNRKVDWSPFDEVKRQDNFWLPEDNEVAVSRQRIAQRFLEKPTWYRYYGKSVEKHEYLQLLAVYKTYE